MSGYSRARGIIPARAGFTLARLTGRTRAKDHPRSRGVYRKSSRCVTSMAGSSPLARGLPTISAEMDERGGIIPARAGFTFRARRAHEWEQDHPRSRGVYPSMKAAMAARAGSSPLARGLPAREELEMTSVRIIPARAGFTDRAPAPRRDSPDHPRSRGVYSLVQPAPERIQGSSPLARGLPWRIWPGCSRLGIIPARAGFTRLSQWSHEVPPDHPRSRGVYYLWTDAGQFGAGSSPLARGLQEPSRRARAPGRIIPARAGFTSLTQPNPTSGPDHPRSRGVYTSPAPQTTCCTGSSPLARGLLSVASGVPETVLDHPRSRGVYAARAALVRGREDHPRSRGVYRPATSPP